MHGMQGQEARVETTQDDAVVTAHEITRRYGEGDTAVDALRGVSLDVAPGQLTRSWAPRARASRR